MSQKEEEYKKYEIVNRKFIGKIQKNLNIAFKVTLNVKKEGEYDLHACFDEENFISIKLKDGQRIPPISYDSHADENGVDPAKIKEMASLIHSIIFSTSYSIQKGMF